MGASTGGSIDRQSIGITKRTKSDRYEWELLRGGQIDQSEREGGEARNIGQDPLASCFCFELRGVTDSLAIRVATVPVPVWVPFSVQSKICKIDSMKY